MKNKIKKTLLSLGALIIVLGTRVSFSEPGSDRDPLISKSYVDNKIEEVKIFINDKIKENLQVVEEEVDEVKKETLDDLQVVELVRNQSLILDQGSEAILRSGSAKAISKITNGIDNGLADITAGKDLKMNEEIKANHLLLTPRGDGRGLKVISDSIFLVRGVYEIR